MTTKVSSNELSTTGVTARIYGGSSTIPVITTDASGRITSAANVTPSITGAQLAAGAANTNLGFTPYNATNPSAYQTTSGYTAAANTIKKFEFFDSGPKFF